MPRRQPVHTQVPTQPRGISLLAAGLFFACAIAPVACMIGASLVHEGRFSLRAYESLLTSSREHVLLARTLAIGLGTGAVAVAVGVPFAIAVRRTNVAFRGVFSAVALAGILIPSYFHAIAWTILLTWTAQGTSGVSATMLRWLHSPLGAVLVLALAHLPYVILLTLSGLESIDGRLEEAARLSRGAWRTLWGVTIPLLRPHVFCGATLVFVFAVTDYGVPSLLGVNTYPLEIFVQFSAFFDEAKATATAVPVILVSTLVLGWQLRSMRQRPYVSFSSGASRPPMLVLGKRRRAVFACLLLVLAFSVVFPAGVLTVASGKLETFWLAWKGSWRELVESLVLAAASATAATALAFPLGYVLARSGTRWTRGLDFLTLVPMAVPGTLLGIGLIHLWNRPVFSSVYGSWSIMLIAMLGRFCPFAVRVLVSSVQQLDVQFEEAARTAGIGWTRRTARIVLPNCADGLLGAWFLVFVLTLGELSAILLVIPSGRETLSLKIYNLTHYGAWEIVAALCVMLLVLGLALLVMLRLGLRVFER